MAIKYKEVADTDITVNVLAGKSKNQAKGRIKCVTRTVVAQPPRIKSESKIKVQYCKVI